ncbi:hypothetical protein GCM10022225_48450 [Plantactinospora mayteni]|uniref:SnoaL-like domain-containing protein n=1 Tax=Plantactinospora mayteni TaxID=566021 RepID=A0ABQ4ESK0_9ACTN|nr:hypothetical protein [Plantactinospora mayteni]GIG97644.1 hypothetical protein Pma05_42170 [Plantactinospora mayteni]
MLEEVVSRWHAAVNQRDLPAARAAVTDPVDVTGPRGTGPISADAFTQWIVDSGIALHPVSWHPVDADTIVVEQDATWPDPTAADAARTAPTRVATLFRVRDRAVAVVHRYEDLHAALRAAADPTPDRHHLLSGITSWPASDPVDGSPGRPPRTRPTAVTST